MTATTTSPSKGKSPLPTPTPPRASAATAQDLLNDVMGLNRPANGGQFARALKASSGPSSQSPSSQSSAFLFGSEPRHSIWSAAQDEQGLKFSASTGQMGHHPSYSLPYNSPAPDVSQYPNGHLNNAHDLGVFLNTPSGLPQANLAVGYQRTPPSIPGPEYFPNRHPNAYVYSSPFPPQQPPQLLDNYAPAFPAYVNPQAAYDQRLYQGPPSPAQAYHARHLSYQDPKPMGQMFVQSPMSQGWGNGG